MMDGNPYPLPDTWAESSIGDVIVKAEQRDPRKTPEKEFQYVDVSSVSRESFRITGATPTLGSEAPSRARKAIQEDDVLFATVIDLGDEIDLGALAPDFEVGLVVVPLDLSGLVRQTSGQMEGFDEFLGSLCHACTSCAHRERAQLSGSSIR